MSLLARRGTADQRTVLHACWGHLIIEKWLIGTQRMRGLDVTIVGSIVPGVVQSS